MARILVISLNTVRAYLNKLTAMGTDIDDLLTLEGPVLEKQFYGGDPFYNEDWYKQLKNWLDYYTSELKGAGMTHQLPWEEYKSDYLDGLGRS